jgi:hypothetical protein
MADRPHRVYITFFLRSGWNVQFLEEDCRTPLPRRFTFADPEKVRELAKFGETWNDDRREELEREIGNGRGGLYLRTQPRSSTESSGNGVRFPPAVDR